MNDPINPPLKTAFPPIVDQNCKVLLLGTMPGDRSLSLQQYYGHAGNHFWKLIYTLFEKPVEPDYEARKKFMLAHGIARSAGIGKPDRFGAAAAARRSHNLLICPPSPAAYRLRGRCTP